MEKQTNLNTEEIRNLMFRTSHDTLETPDVFRLVLMLDKHQKYYEIIHLISTNWKIMELIFEIKTSFKIMTEWNLRLDSIEQDPTLFPYDPVALGLEKTFFVISPPGLKEDLKSVLNYINKDSNLSIFIKKFWKQILMSNTNNKHMKIFLIEMSATGFGMIKYIADIFYYYVSILE